MTMHALLRAALPIAFSVSMGCAANVEGTASPPSGTDDGRVGTTAAALVGNTQSCLSFNVLRQVWTYPDNAYLNMVQFSDDIPDQTQREWWNRTDGCPAMVVDYNRSPPVGQEGQEGFMAGLMDHRLIDAAQQMGQCDSLWESTKIATLSPYEGDFHIRVDETRAACGVDTTLWLGALGAPRDWFRENFTVRVIAQGFALWFPTPVEAYLQSDHSVGSSCPTFAGSCCISCI